ncbi:CE1759 family FMN reductase [Bifidobacterium aquikefiricola]|uniref:NAD(P)H-dependent oxidoreductase n=1 Tax=Bifidobacterium aquikefiricola TaxID=3059038 RepID=A0AB39U6N5_9BIFI
MSDSSTGASLGSSSQSQRDSSEVAGGRQLHHIAVVSAGVGEPSTTTELARGIALKTGELLKKSGARSDITMIELKNLSDDIAVASVTLRISPALQEALNTVQSSDAVIVASPVYKATYSGLFKSFWDVADSDIVLGLPLAAVATGGSERHALVPDTSMRSLFAFMRALIVPTGVMAATGDWGSADLAAHQDRVAAELSALVMAHVHQTLLDSVGEKYTRTFKAKIDEDADSTQSEAAAGLDFGSSLMHLAAGGSL